MNLRNPYTKITDYNNPPFNDIRLFLGIVGNKGIDSIYKADSPEKPSRMFLDMRCRLNTPKEFRVFVCAIKTKYVPDFNKFDSNELYRKLKEVSINFQEIGENNESTQGT